MLASPQIILIYWVRQERRVFSCFHSLAKFDGQRLDLFLLCLDLKEVSLKPECNRYCWFNSTVVSRF